MYSVIVLFIQLLCSYRYNIGEDKIIYHLQGNLRQRLVSHQVVVILSSLCKLHAIQRQHAQFIPDLDNHLYEQYNYGLQRTNNKPPKLYVTILKCWNISELKPMFVSFSICQLFIQPSNKGVSDMLFGRMYYSCLEYEADRYCGTNFYTYNYFFKLPQQHIIRFEPCFIIVFSLSNTDK